MTAHEEHVAKARDQAHFLAEDLQTAHGSADNPAERILLLEMIGQAKKTEQWLEQMQ